MAAGGARMLSPTSPQGRAARLLMRGCNRAALATSMPSDDAPRPYVSLVTVAFDHDATPLLLLSRLAEHTRNIQADARVSLLFEATAGLVNPQEGPRVSLVGRALPSGTQSHLRRFLARHPAAALYAGFADFSIYRIDGEAAHYVGGFARAAWIRGPLLADAEAARRVAAAEEETLRRLNDGRPDLVAACAGRLGRAGGDWRLSGIDPDGADLTLGDEVLRLAFPEMLTDPAAVEEVLDRLAAGA